VHRWRFLYFFFLSIFWYKYVIYLLDLTMNQIGCRKGDGGWQHLGQYTNLVLYGFLFIYRKGGWSKIIMFFFSFFFSWCLDSSFLFLFSTFLIIILYLLNVISCNFHYIIAFIQILLETTTTIRLEEKFWRSLKRKR